MSCQCEPTAPCGCCEGPRILTPRDTANRPGLRALAVRVGTHASFLETMKARLASQDFPALRDLTTRASDDPAIAMLDAWATAADVLTFYTERTANEGYLRTALERRSVLELARLTGYRPRPGVAASVFLAFTLDAGAALEIPVGQPARSIPAPGTTDLPQTFETSHPLKARAELNRVRPRMSVPQEITPENVMNLSTIYLQGTALNLKANDLLVFSFAGEAESTALRYVESTTVDQVNKRTKVALQLDELSVPFFMQRIRAALAAVKDATTFRPADPLVSDAYAFADGLLPKLTEENSLATLDRTVLEALKVTGTSSKASLHDIASFLHFIAANASDLLAASAQARRIRAEAFTGLKGGVDERLAEVRNDNDLLQEILDFPTPTGAADVQAARDFVDLKFPGFKTERLGGAVSAFAKALTTALGTPATAVAAYTSEIATLATIQGPAAAKTALDAVVKSSFGKESELSSVEEVFLGSGTGTLADIKTSPGATPAFQQRVDELSAKLATLFKDYIGVLKPIRKLVVDLPPAGGGTLVKIGEIDRPRAAYAKAFGNLESEITTLPARPNYTKLAAALAALDQPTSDHDVVNGFITLAGAVEQFRGRVIDLRSALISRTLALAARYSFLAAGGTDAREIAGSLETLSKAVAALAAKPKIEKLDETTSIETLAVLFGSEKEPPPDPTMPLPLTKQKLRSAQESLRVTLRRLLAELRALVAQVTTKPSGTPAAPFSLSATGAGLDPLRSEIDSRARRAIGGPLDVEHDLRKSFGVEGQQAGDMVARTIAVLSGATEDDFFAVWRQFKSGEIGTEVFVFRQKSAVFGNNASRGEDVGKSPDIDPNKRFERPEGVADWTLRAIDVGESIALESEFPLILPKSFIAIQRPGEQPVCYRIHEVKSGPRTVYGLAGKSTEVLLEGGIKWGAGFVPPNVARSAGPAETAPRIGPEPQLPAFEIIRRTVVYAQSETMMLAEEPVHRAFGKDAGEVKDSLLGEDHQTFELAGLHQGIDTGRLLIVQGERSDGISGARVSEPAFVERVEHVLLSSTRDGVADDAPPAPRPGDTPHTRIVLSKPLAFSYKRETVEIFANVIDATHGETRAEVLGNGDARVEFQRFEIKQPPVTFTAAPTAAGAESSLAVRVNDVLWHEAESFAALGAADRRFVTETDDDGKARVIFGNGREGARLPTDSENVRARYRNGIGKPGNVKAGAISQLTSKPLGLKDVINPLRSSGGADRDSREQMRRNAPLATLALERLVSLRDYQDFAQTFAGIGKASATRLSDGGGRFVHVTIAGLDDIPIDTTSDLFANFTASLGRAGDPHLRVCVQPRELVLLVLVAKVRVQADYLWEKVEPKLRAALLEAFGFERRALGQSAAASEVLGVMQAVEGVDYVDVDSFGGIPEKQSDGSGGRAPLSPQDIANRVSAMKSAPRVPAALAGYEPPPAGVPGTDSLRPAQLAIFSPDVRDTLILKEIKP